MARFYFDIHDGPFSCRDVDGQELPTLDDAKLEAFRALTEISRDLLPPNDQSQLQIDVRDANDKVLLTARLLMEVLRRS